MSRQTPTLDHWQHDPWDDADQTGALEVEELRKHRPRFRWIVYTMGLLGIIAIVVAGLVGLWYVRKVNPPGDAGAAITFTVNKDDTLDKVADRLEQVGLVTDAGLFKFYVDHHGGLKLTAGYYRVRKSDHMGNVMRVLGTPPEATFTKLTFPEGYTVAKMAARLEKLMPRLTAASFVAASKDGKVRSVYLPAGNNNLEGLLFPDTYQVSNAEPVSRVVRRMVTLFDRVAGQEKLEEKSRGLFITPYQAVIIASMIEREARTDADRPLIARVIYNRMSLKWPLGIDATSFYDAPEGTKVMTKAMVESDSPYNTRKRPGLPPTPIANPGRESLHAALNPAPPLAPNDPMCKDAPGRPCMLLYYVLKDDDGNHAFVVSAEQFEVKKQEARDKGLLDA